MGKRSARENKNIYQLSREEAGLTREKAASALKFISADRIENHAFLMPFRRLRHRLSHNPGPDNPAMNYAPDACKDQYADQNDLRKLSYFFLRISRSFTARRRT